MEQVSASLLTAQSMGGINGGKGYNFQDAYILSKIPGLLLDSNFVQILKEGSGDVEIKYVKNGEEIGTYTQVKDHRITPSEFIGVLTQFKVKDEAAPGTFKKFILASTGLNEDVQTLRTTVERIRNTNDFYSIDSKVILDTHKDLAEAAKSIGITLPTDVDFILKKVYFDTTILDISDLNLLIQLFCGAMLNLESYKQKTGYFRHIFCSLYPFIANSSGKAISRDEMEKKMNELIEEYKHQMEESGLNLRIYHWEDMPYELNAKDDEVLDWSKYFDRNSRKIASTDIWENELLPQLSDVQRRLRASINNRLVRIAGSSCLSGGIAIGYSFPEVAGYTIELQARLGPKTEIWSTDKSPSQPYQLKSSLVSLGNDSSELAVKFNMVADVSNDFNVYIAESGAKFGSALELYPQTNIGEFLNSESAIGYARDAKRLIREAATKLGSKKIHVFFAGALGMAIFFGQQLNSMPEIQCYEQKKDGGYQLSCLLPRT